MTLKAVVFDMDETLIDWRRFKSDWKQMSRAHLAPVYDFLQQDGHDVPPFDTLVDTIARLSDETWLSMQNGGKLDAPRLVEVVERSLLELGMKKAARKAEDIVRHYGWQQIEGTQLYPDVKAVIAELQHAGVKAGLLTNAFQPMWLRDRELAALGVLDDIPCRVSAADVGKLKPHNRPFKTVLKCLGASPSEAVFVGDSLQADVRGAQDMGMRAVWRRHAYHSQTPEEVGIQPDATIDALSELLPTLDEWYGGWRDV